MLVTKTREIFLECMGNVDAETINTTIRPELKSFKEVELNFAVIPVEVRLFWRKEMEVPLT